jgi:hypothetical protein
MKIASFNINDTNRRLMNLLKWLGEAEPDIRRRCFAFIMIATMDSSAPLPSLTDQAPTWGSASSLARSSGLNQLEPPPIRLHHNRRL